jgi:hypothetical protein
MCELLSKQFISVFSPHGINVDFCVPVGLPYDNPSCYVSLTDVQTSLVKITSYKIDRPKFALRFFLFINLGLFMCFPVLLFYSKSLSEDVFPDIRKISSVTPFLSQATLQISSVTGQSVLLVALPNYSSH